VRTSLAHLDLAGHLDLSYNNIRDEGAGRLAAVLPRCTLLAHLDVNGIGAEGAGRFRAAALPPLNSEISSGALVDA